MIRFLRTFVLFCVALGLLTLAGYMLGSSALAMPAALAGLSTFVLALAQPPARR